MGSRLEKENQLSKLVIGFAFEVYNTLGFGLSEKIYQKAFETKLKENGICYQREKYCKIMFRNTPVGKYFLDFLIDQRLAVELKVRNEIYQTHINQLLNYLKSENIQLGLLLTVSKKGLLIKRVIN